MLRGILRSMLLIKSKLHSGHAGLVQSLQAGLSFLVSRIARGDTMDIKITINNGAGHDQMMGIVDRISGMILNVDTNEKASGWLGVLTIECSADRAVDIMQELQNEGFLD